MEWDHVGWFLQLVLGWCHCIFCPLPNPHPPLDLQSSPWTSLRGHGGSRHSSTSQPTFTSRKPRLSPGPLIQTILCLLDAPRSLQEHRAPPCSASPFLSLPCDFAGEKPEALFSPGVSQETLEEGDNRDSSSRCSGLPVILPLTFQA